MPAASLSKQATAIRQSAARELCKRSTLDMMRFTTIRNDDPVNPAFVPFTPWQYQTELLQMWDNRISTVISKARQIGGSTGVGGYMLKRAMFNNWNVGYFSRGDVEARDHLETRVLSLWETMPEWLRKPYRRRDMLIEFKDGGTIHTFPATKSAGISYTMNLIIADEAAHHPWGAENYVNYSPALSAGGQYIALSTADHELGPSGFFYDLFTQATPEHWGHTPSGMWVGDTPGANGYTGVFIPWNIRPDRGQRGSEWWTRERQKFLSISEDAFNSQYPETPAEAFVGRSGLVFPQFEHQRHVRADPCAWEDCLARYAGYDLGHGDPTAVVILGVYRASDGSRRVHQFGEYYKPTGSATINELAAYLMPWHNRAPFDHIEPDPVGAARIVAETLRAIYHMPVPEKLVSRDRGERLSTQAWWLETGLLTISPECRYSIAEFGGYRWRTNIDPNDRTRYRTTTPVDNHADAMDARGQVLVRIYADELNFNGERRLTAAKVRWI